MWANYMNDEVRRQTPLTYAQYISKYEELLKEGYNQRYKDGRS
jgi:hypothetical protein